ALNVIQNWTANHGPALLPPAATRRTSDARLILERHVVGTRRLRSRSSLASLLDRHFRHRRLLERRLHFALPPYLAA
ncbi:MAG: hypothetical protein LC808_12975, partial [Actinobacteria bacterium]|nr:hypothetical protein [Actinomycetota bacterium]